VVIVKCKQKGQLKRKVLYGTEMMVDETWGKMARMRIDGTGF